MGHDTWAEILKPESLCGNICQADELKSETEAE